MAKMIIWCMMWIFLGVSLIQTYKAQFEDLGLRADFNTILSRLNAMNELDKKEPKPTNNK